MKKFVITLAATAAVVVGLASPAFAHASAVTHVESCLIDQTTSTVVTFDNDYNLTAKVYYEWNGEATTADPFVSIAADNGPGTTHVSLPAHVIVGANDEINYLVVWTDNFKQPSSGDSELTINAKENCPAPPTTTTTMPPTTTTTVPPTTTTTAPPVTTTTAPPVTTTTVPPVVVTTTAPPVVVTTVPEAPHYDCVAPDGTQFKSSQPCPAAPAPVAPAPVEELPHTGSGVAVTALVGLGLLAAGIIFKMVAKRRSA